MNTATRYTTLLRAMDAAASDRERPADFQCMYPDRSAPDSLDRKALPHLVG